MFSVSTYNPFQTMTTPPIENTAVADTADEGKDKYDYRRVASAQRLLLIAILLKLLILATYMGIPVVMDDQAVIRAVITVLRIAEILINIFSIVCLFRLALSLRWGGCSVALLAIGVFVPLLGLILLFIVNGKASTILQQSGYRVGLLGANMRQFNNDD